jgi:hypothetical protein
LQPSRGSCWSAGSSGLLCPCKKDRKKPNNAVMKLDAIKLKLSLCRLRIPIKVSYVGILLRRIKQDSKKKKNKKHCDLLPPNQMATTIRVPILTCPSPISPNKGFHPQR